MVVAGEHLPDKEKKYCVILLGGQSNMVQSAQRKIARDPDQVHYDTEGQLELGRCFR